MNAFVFFCLCETAVVYDQNNFYCLVHLFAKEMERYCLSTVAARTIRSCVKHTTIRSEDPPVLTCLVYGERPSRTSLLHTDGFCRNVISWRRDHDGFCFLQGINDASRSTKVGWLQQWTDSIIEAFGRILLFDHRPRENFHLPLVQFLH